VDVRNLRSPCSEEIRELVNPHFSFTRGRNGSKGTVKDL
jgi:hypothetical protein